MSDQNDPSIRSDQHTKIQAYWNLVDALSANSTAMQNISGEGYLIRNPAEDPAQYTDRKKRSYLPEGFKEAVNESVGKIFDDDNPISRKEIHPDIEPLLDDFDMQGNSIEVVAASLAHDICKYGVSMGVVDVADTSAMREHLSEQGLMWTAEYDAFARPYFAQIKPIDGLGGFCVNVGSAHLPVQVRVAFKEDQRSGAFGVESVDKIRVYALDEQNEYVVSVYSQDSEGKWIAGAEHKPLANGAPLNQIPFIDMYASKELQTGFMTAYPPMLNLAENTKRLYNAESDLDNLIHIVEAAILVHRGHEDLNLQVGGKLVRIAPGESLDFVEHSGKGVEAGEKQVERIRKSRALMGLADMLADKPGSVTATARVLDGKASNNLLTSLVIALESGLNQAIRLIAQWKGIDPDKAGSVQINKDFGLPMMTNDDAQQIIQAYREGMLGKQDALEALKQIIPALADLDVEVALLRAEEAVDLLGAA